MKSDPPELRLECGPDEAAALQQRYAAVKPGYHLNEQHGDTAACDGSAEDELILKRLNTVL